MCVCFFFFSSRRRHTRFRNVTGVQTCALPICDDSEWPKGKTVAARADLSRSRERDAFDVEFDRTTAFRRAVLTLRGCYNKRLRLYSRWFRLLLPILQVSRNKPEIKHWRLRARRRFRLGRFRSAPVAAHEPRRRDNRRDRVRL